MIPTEFVNRLILGDCVKAMQLLPANCIPLTVTSPPFDGIRDYGGHEFEFEWVAEELYRITCPGGVVVWVVQEQVVEGAQTGTSSAQRLIFQETGFTLYDSMVMVSNGDRLPQPNRYVNRFQHAFVVSKGKPRSVTILRDKPNKYAGATVRGVIRNRDGRLRDTRTESVIQEFGRRSNVWDYAVGGGKTTTDAFAFQHPALMPEKMAEDHIRSWSRPHDLVFDPFCGAGTTCKMALLTDRRYLGVEIHDEYFAVAAKRLRLAHEEYDRRLSALDLSTI